ncbi:uncharacterized protein SOCEGT47_069040 [Sorangium cellulosum]|uniref:Uncharacterized protein n=1 Tax=Sorangium cellulosum TaxID=56 RepID=A0A4P2QB60_SORCE|nr:hypothetical protein [Sorangium cellulosum]AUX26343.1 uncharacterized protein SOCEGT47_069040 [Sorangium cellulosum]
MKNGDDVAAKNAVRGVVSQRRRRAPAAVRAGYRSIDRAVDLVDVLEYTRPAEMDAAGLLRASLAETPWSDDYWPIYAGGLGRRYADPGFPSSSDWKENFDYIREHPAQAIVRSGDQGAIDRLSPSEKHELLIGDASGALTTAMWDEGRQYHERDGKVELWMGLCHGWAPAAYMLRRPRKMVSVKAADGRTELRFFPSDIEALATLLWAKAGAPTRFIGSRSNERSPRFDEVGRVLSPAAFDTNPGTWHLCVVNQIAVAQRSFILDVTYDYEVWNQPVHSYEDTYFNPQTLEPAADVGRATVPRDRFTNDKFRRYRDVPFASVLGVSMTVHYVVETSPTHAKMDDPSRDQVHSTDYRYDLELDAEGKVVGGEWYQSTHPDFLWTPPPRARAATGAEHLATGRWTAQAPLPASWRRAASSMAGRSLPLARIVEQLIDLASA